MNKIVSLAIAILTTLVGGCGPLDSDNQERQQFLFAREPSKKVLKAQLREAQHQLQKSTQELREAKNERAVLALERDEALALIKPVQLSECAELKIKLLKVEKQAAACIKTNKHVESLENENQERAQAEARLRANLAETKADKEQLKARHENELTTTLNEKLAREQELKDQIANLNNQILANNQEHDLLSKNNIQKELSLEELTKQLNDHKNIIKNNEDKIRNLNKLETKITNLNNINSNLNTKIATNLLELEKITQENFERAQSVSNLEYKIKAQEEMLSENRNKILELNKIRENLILKENALLKSLEDFKKAQEEIAKWKAKHDELSLLRNSQVSKAADDQRKIIELEKSLQEKIKISEELQAKAQNQELEFLLLAKEKEELAEKQREMTENLRKLMPREEDLAKSFLDALHHEEEKAVQSEETDHDKNSLVTYEKTKDSIKLGINFKLNALIYQDILFLNDLSYAVAKESTVIPEKVELVKKRIEETDNILKKNGWLFHKTINGKTGYDNKNDDKTCIIYYNKPQNIIVISFHGSRSGDMGLGWMLKSTDGDWAANYDYEVIKGDFKLASGEQLRHVPSDIELHRGFASNFLSAQTELLDELKAVLKLVDKNPLVIVSGHSKGGAMASIAAPIIKLELQAEASVFAVLLSSPRVFHGDHSRSWVHKTVGKRNILHINVLGDLATQFPPHSIRYSYRSIGMLALDSVSNVDKRIYKLGGQTIGYLDIKAKVGRYHYALARREGFGFEPQIVMTFEEITAGFENGRQNMSQEGPLILTESFVQAK